jgi:hypothetical protein
VPGALARRTESLVAPWGRRHPLRGGRVDPAVTEYLEAVPEEHRELFEWVHGLILDACPTAVVGLSYRIPTYRLGRNRLHVGVWAHGVSIYGWKRRGDGGLTARHPGLQTSTGTIQLRPEDRATVSDQEIRELARRVLADAS